MAWRAEWVLILQCVSSAGKRSARQSSPFQTSKQKEVVAPSPTLTLVIAWYMGSKQLAESSTVMPAENKRGQEVCSSTKLT
jgi:hypothetical protein